MRLKLIYPHGEVQRPVLAEAVLELGVLINILEAAVNADKGELIVSVEADKEKLAKVIHFFQEKGVTVEKLTRILEIDRNKCVDCGACVSPCPVGAVKITPDWSVEFDEERCVGCKICVNACPVRAIKLIT
jgi:ferredoxin